MEEDLKYLFSKINWGSSFLDGKAIDIMNTLDGRVASAEEMLDNIAYWDTCPQEYKDKIEALKSKD